MDDGKLAKGNDRNDQSPPRARSLKYANIRSNNEAVLDEQRSHFIREIEGTAPEVLEKLRDSVLPEYINAYNAAKDSGAQQSRTMVRFPWPDSLQIAVLTWAKDVRLLHKGKLPDWVLAQADVTLWLWTRRPDLLSNSLRWCFTGGYSAERRTPSNSFVIEVPTFTWHWQQGCENKTSAKQRIMEAVGEIVDQRLDEMEQILENLPRVPAKRAPEHFTWTVLHQIRGVRLQDIAAQSGVAAATVKNEVLRLKRRLGISLPKGRRRAK
jgi:hypothetical protein